MRRSVLITGASRGFGRLIALDLAARGWRVVATMRDPAAADGLLAEARAANVAAPETLALDVTFRPSIDAAVAAAGPLDAVVLNAGIAGGGCFEDVAEADVRAIFETNVLGTMAVARAVLPVLRASGESRLVVIGSDAGIYGTPGLSIYSASKHALEGWAESLALEVAPFGVRVALLEPGNFRTDIWDTEMLVRDGSPYEEMAQRFAAMGEKLVTRAGDPARVARVVADVLEGRRPGLRHPVGVDARAMAAARRLLPDRLRLRCMALISGAGR